jgi:putative ABC transport system ATP-binding protein
MSDRAAAVPAIELVDVVKRFPGERGRVLDGVTFSVEPGEFVVLTGPSGSGKSTTIHLVAALDRLTSGTIRVRGRDVRRGHALDRFRRTEVGVVFQLHNLLPHLDARQNIEVVMFGTHRRRHDRAARADELLDRLGLRAQAAARPPELSGGERQRVAVARAFANDPHVVLADEPTGSLDDDSAAIVVRMLRDHCTAGGSVLAVSHDARLTSASDRVLTLAGGRITDDTAGGARGAA